MDLQAHYKQKLLEHYEPEFKALSPEYEAEENLDWLWSSFNSIENADEELICGLSQIALHYGRSRLGETDIDQILHHPQLSNQQKLEAVIEQVQA